MCGDFHRNIEDILAEKGEAVKKSSESDTLEVLLQEKGEGQRDKLVEE